MSKNDIEVLIISPHQDINALLSGRLERFGYNLKQVSDLNELLQATDLGTPKICIVDGNMKGSDTAENILSVLRDEFPEAYKLVAYTNVLEPPSDLLYRSGARNIYQLPFEEELLINDIFQEAPKEIENRNLDVSVMTKVNILDFSKCDTLPFDTYVVLPKNKKVILYQRKDSQVENDVIEDLSKRKLDLYIRKTDMDAYHKFLADQIAGGKDQVDLKMFSASMKKEVRRMLNKVFHASELSPDEQAVLLDSMKKVTLNLLEKMGGGEKLLSRLQAFTSEAFSNFNHSTNVATYSSMFAIVAGYDDVEDIFLGGLLHDIGHSESEGDFQSDIEKDETHSLLSMDILNRKGVKVSEAVESMILQHHECPDGSGFPNQLTADQIHPYAKICALADYFDQATSLSSGKERLSPTDALLDYVGQGAYEPHETYEEAFHLSIVEAILKGEQEEETPQLVEDHQVAQNEESLNHESVEDDMADLEMDPDNIDEEELLKLMMSSDGASEDKTEEELLQEAFENFKPDDAA